MTKTELEMAIMTSELTGSEIVELMELLRIKHGVISSKAKRSFKIGDLVEFDGGKHGIIRGKVEAIAIKYVKVRQEPAGGNIRGMRWSVLGASLKKI